MKHLKLRRQLIQTCVTMNAVGLNQGRSGNVSARVPEGVLITPSGMDYARMRPSDLVVLDADGGVASGTRTPSSEWRFHVDIHNARPAVGAVLHAHAEFCTTLACLRRGIPAFHYMIAVAGGDSIRCAPYSTFGTPELSEHALAALQGRDACLLSNHGMIALGATLGKALALAVEVESLAAQYWRALQVGEPAILDEEQMARVLEKFKTYGEQTG